MTITVGELIEALSIHDNDDEVYFGGLDSYRVKSRSEKIVQVEFKQTVSKNKKTGEVNIENHVI